MLRIDPAELIFGLRLNVWTSILVLLGATAAFVVVGRRTGEADPVGLPGRATPAVGDEESQVDQAPDSERDPG